MFLSGYVYHLNGDWKCKGSVHKFMLYKLLNLGVPYFVFSSIYIIINSVMNTSVNTEFAFLDILFLYKKPVAQYWYLYMLFWLFLIFSVAGKFIKNWQLTLILFIIQIIVSVFNLNFGFLGGTMCLMFGLGASTKTLYIDKANLYLKVILVVLHVVMVQIMVCTSIDKYLILGPQLEACIGIVGSTALISLVSNVGAVKKFLLWLSDFSFPVYVLHTIFTAGIRIILFKLRINSYFIHVVLGMIFGIGIPFIIAKISNKLKPLDFFFYPSKTLKSRLN